MRKLDEERLDRMERCREMLARKENRKQGAKPEWKDKPDSFDEVNLEEVGNGRMD